MEAKLSGRRKRWLCRTTSFAGLMLFTMFAVLVLIQAFLTHQKDIIAELFFPIEAQRPPYPANMAPHDGVWQDVDETQDMFFVFSAFLDQRQKQSVIRVIGATRTQHPEEVWCRVWNHTASHTVPAKIKVIRENWKLKYSACFVLCPVTSHEDPPMAVSVIKHPESPPTNLLPIIDNRSKKTSTTKFAVCVKPFHYDYNKSLQLLEFVELTRILGADHFFFYNHSVGPQVSHVLRHYVDKGLVTLLPWQLDMVSQKEIRTEGMFAAFNDCLYRSMYLYSHLVVVDLDEFIVPRDHDTLPQLVKYLDLMMKNIVFGAYTFQNAFFYLEWADDESVYDSNDGIAAGLVTMRKNKRNSKLNPHRQRSKYVCKPELVVELGNHFVWEFVKGVKNLNVPPSYGISQHYRICEVGGDVCVETSVPVKDTTVLRYKERLVERVRKKIEYFKSKGQVIVVPTVPSR